MSHKLISINNLNHLINNLIISHISHNNNSRVSLSEHPAKKSSPNSSKRCLLSQNSNKRKSRDHLNTSFPFFCCHKGTNWFHSLHLNPLGVWHTKLVPRDKKIIFEPFFIVLCQIWRNFWEFRMQMRCGRKQKIVCETWEVTTFH